MDSHRSGHSTRAPTARSALPTADTDPPAADPQLRDDIQHSAEQLRNAYCVVATTELVLRSRSYQEDLKLAGWLRCGVLDPLGREVERLSCRLVQLGGDAVILP